MTARLLYNQKEAAAVLGVCVNTFKRHVRPELRRVTVAGNVMFPATELERWVSLKSESV